jgi:hypothetical protein
MSASRIAELVGVFGIASLGRPIQYHPRGRSEVARPADWGSVETDRARQPFGATRTATRIDNPAVAGAFRSPTPVARGARNQISTLPLALWAAPFRKDRLGLARSARISGIGVGRVTPAQWPPDRHGGCEGKSRAF